jgi:hypothetical protein
MTTNGKIQSQTGHVNHLSNFWPNMENLNPKLDRFIVQAMTENLHFLSQLGLVHKLGCDQNPKTLVTSSIGHPLV